MNHHKHPSFPTFLFILLMVFSTSILVIQNTENVNAFLWDFDYYTASWSDTYFDYDKNNAHNQEIYHSSGRNIFGAQDFDSNVLRLWIHRIDGTLESTPTIPTWRGSWYTQKFSLVSLDNDEILIANQKTTNGVDQEFYIRRLNLNTLVVNTYSVNLGSGWTQQSYFGDINYVTYSGVYYFSFTNLRYTGLSMFLHVCSFDPSTNTLQNENKTSMTATDATPALGAITNMIQNPNDETVVLIQTLPHIGNTVYDLQPHYYRFDISTGYLDKIAEHPLLTNEYSKERQMLVLGGSMEDYGAYRYAWFNYAFPYDSAGETEWRVVQHRLVFNSTGLVDMNGTAILYQNKREYIQAWSENFPNWCFGHMNEKDVFHMWFRMYDDEFNDAYTVHEKVLTVDDFYNIGIGTIVQTGFTGVVQSIIPHYRQICARVGTSPFMVEISPDFEYAYIYYGLTVVERSWDITNTYYPSDSPLYTNTRYTFTTTTFENYFPFSCTVLWYIDNIQVATGVSTTAGAYVQDATFTTTGVKNFTYVLYDTDTGQYLYAETFTYTFIEPIDPEQDEVPPLLPIFISGFINFLPMFFLIIIPTVALAQYLGSIGAIAGLVIGTIASVGGGFVPAYGVFLLILIVVMAFIWYVRKGGGVFG